MTTEPQQVVPQKRRQPWWLVYLALILAGLVLLGDAVNLAHLSKWTARLGFAFVYTALALMIGNGRAAGYVATGIIWIAIIVVYFV